MIFWFLQSNFLYIWKLFSYGYSMKCHLIICYRLNWSIFMYYEYISIHFTTAFSTTMNEKKDNKFLITFDSLRCEHASILCWWWRCWFRYSIFHIRIGKETIFLYNIFEFSVSESVSSTRVFYTDRHIHASMWITWMLLIRFKYVCNSYGWQRKQTKQQNYGNFTVVRYNDSESSFYFLVFLFFSILNVTID